MGSDPARNARETGRELRSRPHLSDVARDAEAHDLAKLHPDDAKRLAAALDEMSRSVRENPRGWRPLGGN